MYSLQRAARGRHTLFAFNVIRHHQGTNPTSRS
jgi:hypothetical protein